MYNDLTVFLLSQEILYACGETASTVGVISKVFSYLDRSPKCKRAGELAPEKLQGRIVFQNVTFTYPSEDKPVLKVTAGSIDLMYVHCGHLEWF